MCSKPNFSPRLEDALLAHVESSVLTIEQASLVVDIDAHILEIFAVDFEVHPELLLEDHDTLLPLKPRVTFERILNLLFVRRVVVRAGAERADRNGPLHQKFAQSEDGSNLLMVLTGVIPDEVLLIHAMMVVGAGFLVETERNLRHPRRKPRLSWKKD